MLKKISLRLAMMASLSGLLQAAPVSAEEIEAGTALVVATAGQMEFDGSIISLSNPDREVVWFSDRPNRESGSVTFSEFLKVWGDGSDSFETDPPNAVVIVEGQVNLPVIVELSNPQMTEGGVVFDVTPIHGELPDTAGTTSIVFDDISSTQWLKDNL